MLNWFLQKMRPHTQHMMRIILDKPDQTLADDEKIKKVATLVKNDMEMIHMTLKMLEKELDDRHKNYVAIIDQLTFIDIAVYNEISQVLCMYDYFMRNSRAPYFKKLLQENPEVREEDQLDGYTKLCKWYRGTM